MYHRDCTKPFHVGQHRQEPANRMAALCWTDAEPKNAAVSSITIHEATGPLRVVESEDLVMPQRGRLVADLRVRMHEFNSRCNIRLGRARSWSGKGEPVVSVWRGEVFHRRFDAEDTVVSGCCASIERLSRSSRIRRREQLRLCQQYPLALIQGRERRLLHLLVVWLDIDGEAIPDGVIGFAHWICRHDLETLAR